MCKYVLYIYQIADGMQYVHLKKIIHRDLKPSNILIGFDGNIRISDFGISKLMTDDEISMTTGVVTQKFMVPELINEIQYNEKVDVYSFGVLVYFILSKEFDLPSDSYLVTFHQKLIGFLKKTQK